MPTRSPLMSTWKWPAARNLAASSEGRPSLGRNQKRTGSSTPTTTLWLRYQLGIASIAEVASSITRRKSIMIQSCLYSEGARPRSNSGLPIQANDLIATGQYDKPRLVHRAAREAPHRGASSYCMGNERSGRTSPHDVLWLSHRESSPLTNKAAGYKSLVLAGRERRRKALSPDEGQGVGGSEPPKNCESISHQRVKYVSTTLPTLLYRRGYQRSISFDAAFAILTRPFIKKRRGRSNLGLTLQPNRVRGIPRRSTEGVCSITMCNRRVAPNSIHKSVKCAAFTKRILQKISVTTVFNGKGGRVPPQDG